MRRALTAIALLGSGCGQPPCTPAPVWTLAASSNIRARALADGSLVVLVTDVGPATVGATTVDGPALVHVDGSGVVVASAHVPMTTAARDLRIDDGGGVAVVGAMSDSVARYDLTFAPVWSIGGNNVLTGTQFDIAPTGDVAYVSGAFPTPGTLHELDPAGHERWTFETPGASEVRFDADGNLYLLEIGYQEPAHRLRFAPDGTMLEDVDLPAIPEVIEYFELERDGSVVYVADPYATVVTKADASGVLWTLPLHASTSSPMTTATGDVLVLTDLDTAVVRIDGATGTLVDRADNCAFDDDAVFTETPVIVAASASGYVAYTRRPGVVDPPLVGLSAFAGP